MTVPPSIFYSVSNVVSVFLLGELFQGVKLSTITLWVGGSSTTALEDFPLFLKQKMKQIETQKMKLIVSRRSATQYL